MKIPAMAYIVVDLILKGELTYKQVHKRIKKPVKELILKMEMPELLEDELVDKN